MGEAGEARYDEEGAGAENTRLMRRKVESTRLCIVVVKWTAK